MNTNKKRSIQIIYNSMSYSQGMQNCKWRDIAPLICKIVNGETLHRLCNVNPIDYSFEYNKALSLTDSGIKYICIYIYIYIYV